MEAEFMLPVAATVFTAIRPEICINRTNALILQ